MPQQTPSNATVGFVLITNLTLWKHSEWSLISMPKRIYVKKDPRQQRLCDARKMRGDLCGCGWCVRERLRDNQGIRELYEVD
tara:strand:- start:43 stop:288 length:246 start_codon:yes stop_codon:yes gene_type:complete